jgi:hypothetical protein
VQYLGIDWAYRRAAWCAKNGGGDVLDEGVVPADEDGLAERARPPSIATWQKSRCTSNPIDLPTTHLRSRHHDEAVRQAERHLRIRARSAPG